MIPKAGMPCWLIWSDGRGPVRLRHWKNWVGSATTGATVDAEELRQRLKVLPEHKRLFRRMLEMVAKSGVLEETGDRFVVVVGLG